MTAAALLRRWRLPVVVAMLLALPVGARAQAPTVAPERATETVAAEQSRQRTAARRQPRSDQLEIRGFGTASVEWFSASQSFAAILGESRGYMYGGGLSLTQGPGFIDVGAQLFKKDGERAFVGPNDEVFPLGIPTTIRIIPLDVTLGWRFLGLSRHVIPYVGGGYTRLRYEETSDFAGEGEDVKQSYNGYHVLGGAELRLTRLVGLAGEVTWTSVGDALGDSGVSQAFDESNLGGTSLRIKVVIGR